LLGACLLLKREVYQQISGFDPDYFLYGEDADIGLRIRQHGFEIGFCEQVTIEHVSGASEIGADSLDKWLRKRRGIFLFYTKHYDRRDVMRIAKNTIFKSNLGLKWLSITKLLRANVLDRQHRLQATVIVANEVLNELKLNLK
jgi:N-acetylglucosaminyl-diphospho-decaprenol L-rhamnosyltransferase